MAALFISESRSLTHELVVGHKKNKSYTK